MCFTRSSPIDGFYTINSAVLELVNSFNDLGIIFDCKLDFRNQLLAKLNVSWDLLNDGPKNFLILMLTNNCLPHWFAQYLNMDR